MNAETADQPQTKKGFMFKVKINENAVLKDNSYPAIFQIKCAASVSSDQIFNLVRQALISMFGLNIDNIETMTFSLFNRSLQLLNNKLHEPFKTMSIACIPTCELLTKDYPKKGVERDKYINFAPFFIRSSADGKYTLYQRQWITHDQLTKGIAVCLSARNYDFRKHRDDYYG